MPGYCYILVSLGLFFIGTAGVLLRRNALFVLMSLELQLAAGSLALLTFSRGLGDEKGHVVAFFVMALAAAEAAVGLAIVVSVYRTRRKIDLDAINELRN
jgi:NADH-quinone oxidoreductase subunit K